MARQITNDFSWSKSRHEKFKECLRAYYYQYYGSWGGWERGASEEVRNLYVLKKLSNRFTWAGSVVHEAVKGALLDLRVGKSPDVETVIRTAHRTMQEDFRQSSRKAYRSQKIRREFGGLVEHEYDEPLAREEWKRNWEVVEGAIRAFFASRWIPLARSLQPAQWIEVDEGFENAQFVLDGVKVFAIPDFAYRESDGTAVVVDWKTGRAREGYDEQVLGYVLYLSTRYRLPIEKVKASLVYLNEGTEQTVQVDAAAIESFRKHFKASVEEMRRVLRDPGANVPHGIETFPQIEDVQSCSRCVFRRPCGKELFALKSA
jgi:CRISPR/Cas system-associated exonuclease Cas4 (RecB family)